MYSGKFLPDAALSKEDVVPKSLGGNRFTVIYVSRTLNSTFGTKIDARVINDPIIQFGRKDVNARGHSKKKPIPKLTRAHHWNPRATPPPQGPGNYDLNVHGHGPPDVWDRKRGAFTPSSVWAEGGFIMPNLNIDHAARLKFCVKTSNWDRLETFSN